MLDKKGIQINSLATSLKAALFMLGIRDLGIHFDAILRKISFSYKYQGDPGEFSASFTEIEDAFQNGQNSHGNKPGSEKYIDIREIDTSPFKV